MVIEIDQALVLDVLLLLASTAFWKGLHPQVWLIRLLDNKILTNTIYMIFNNIDNIHIMCLSLLTTMIGLIYFFNYLGTSIVLLVLECCIRLNIDRRVLQ